MLREGVMNVRAILREGGWCGEGSHESLRCGGRDGGEGEEVVSVIDAEGGRVVSVSDAEGGW